MSTRFYMFLWLTAIAAASGFYLMGSLTLLAGVIFGFMFFGLTFMGMISVLPAIAHAEVETVKLPEPARARKTRERVAAEVHRFTAAWAEKGVEVRQIRPH